MAGIYIHVPFCSQFCTYCDFYSVKDTGKREAFTEAVIREAEFRKNYFKESGCRVKTIYFGGGTPSLLSPASFRAITESLFRLFNITDPSEIAEFTVEVNPDDATPEYLAALRSAGARRLSMGVQSFTDAHLKWMNRRHDSATALNAFRAAREAGFENISIDLIFGFADLTNEDWRNTLKKAVELSPEHISSYQLGIEPGTKLGRDYETGAYTPLPDDKSYTQYSLLQEVLSGAGYVQYEVSSFARPGREAKHNSSYWNHTPYLGLGPSAHSFNGSVRHFNPPSLAKYLKQTDWDSFAKNEKLSDRDLFNETVMLSLRRKEGLDKELLLSRYPEQLTSPFFSDAERLMALGDLEESGGKIRIPSGKLFISDGIIRELFQ